jgi:nucleotide-binding universal stress UspA family protein
MRGELHILHVNNGDRGTSEGDHFPRVRATLARWGLLSDAAPREAVDEELGILVSKVGIRDKNEADGVNRFLERRGADLVVLGTHARDGLDRLLRGSIAEDIAAKTDIPTLFVPSDARGFVDPQTGVASLKRVLVPIAHDPDPRLALSLLSTLLSRLNLSQDSMTLIHAGRPAPVVQVGDDARKVDVQVEDGDVVDVILARSANADLVAMPTERRNSVLDVLRGTTTERVVRGARCPVLAIPS